MGCGPVTVQGASHRTGMNMWKARAISRRNAISSCAPRVRSTGIVRKPRRPSALCAPDGGACADSVPPTDGLWLRPGLDAPFSFFVNDDHHLARPLPLAPLVPLATGLGAGLGAGSMSSRTAERRMPIAERRRAWG